MSSELKDKDPATRQRRARFTMPEPAAAALDEISFAAQADELAFPAVDPFAPEMDFRVDLSMFRGPLDLLLYLVRKHELDIADIPIARVTNQYMEYLDVLTQLDVDQVGDFVEMASHLVEIKSRMVLPQAEEDSDDQTQEDPRDELVQRLLEYKKYKDAAADLKESSHQWQQRFTRVANDLPPRSLDPAEQPIHEVQLWDLVSAMGRIMREKERLKPLTNIVYDDTPMQVYMQKIHERLVQDGSMAFTDMFEPGMHKAKMIGVFLAILELARNYGVIVEQSAIHGHMVMRCGAEFRPTLEVTEVFTDFVEDSDEVDSETVPAKPR